MTTIARRIQSTPLRTATETWSRIVGLLTADDDQLPAALTAVGNVASMLIAEEHTAAAPIILSQCGPQIRIYTVHGPAAIDSVNVNEQSLIVSVSTGWQLLLPASGLDLQLAQSALAVHPHVEAYDRDDADVGSATGTRSATSIPDPSGRRPVTVDLAVLES